MRNGRLKGGVTFNAETWARLLHAEAAKGEVEADGSSSETVTSEELERHWRNEKKPPGAIPREECLSFH
jgi:hypothetical protein